MILVDSIYTNASGSQRLLEYFIEYSKKNNLLESYFFIFDGRLVSHVKSMVSKENQVTLEPGEASRKKFYQALPSNIKTIYCFGSVPPPVAITTARVIVMAHNPFFFENPGYGLKDKLIYTIKRNYIRYHTKRNYEWVVQNPRMRDILIRDVGAKTEKIHILPFYELSAFIKPSKSTDRGFTFIYPADGVPQKNHIFLFDVWEQLHDKHQLSPELHLTLPDKYPQHLQRIEALQKKGVKIINHGFVPKETMADLYRQCSFMIFPSMSESFGLPLIEATVSGLRVIGSDMAYIYQVIKPSVVFDPKDRTALCNLILSVHKQPDLPESKIVIENKIAELMKYIHQN